jgi:Na+/melibiose symporter-like transporter
VPDVPLDLGTRPAPAAVAVLPPYAARTLRTAAGATLLVLVAFVTPLGTGARTAAALDAGPGLAPWLLSAMALGLAVALLPAGALADDTGRRRVLVGGLLVLAAGSVVCAAATGALAFVAGRVLTGVGGGAVLACSLGVIAHAFPPGPQRGRATGVWGASVGAGIAVGGLVVAAVDQGERWRGSYVLLAAVAVLLAVAASRLLVESRAAVRRRPDVVGALLLAVGLACLLAALVEGRSGAGVAVVVLVAGAALLLAGFVVQEARASAPMVDLALFRSRPFLAATTGALASGLGATALAALTPTVVQGGLGRSLLTASLLVLLFAGSSVVAALQVSRLPARWTGRHLLVGGLLGVAAGQLLQVGIDTGSSPLVLVPGTLVVGVSFGVLNATVGREAVASVPPERAAMGSGANNTARYVGSAIGISLVAVVLAGSEPAGTPAGVVAGWSTAAALTAGLSVLGALVIAALRPSAAR